MSDNPGTPSLSQYFGTTSEQKSKSAEDFSNVLSEATSKINNLQLEDNLKNEPEVCRLFAETPVQPKDPTAMFFDLIGNPSSVSAGDVC